MKFLFSSLILLITISLSLTSSLCPISKCENIASKSSDKDKPNCRMFDQEKNEYKVQKCEDKDKRCPYKNMYNDNKTLTCEKKVIEKYPGALCLNHDECISKNCTELVCIGKKLNETCNETKECSPELFCGKGENEGRCVKQKKVGESCYSFEECVNNAGCNFVDQKCTKYLSLDIGNKTSDSFLCKSLFAIKRNVDGKEISFCASVVQSGDKECKNDQKVCNVTINEELSYSKEYPCTCTYTYPDRKFCSQLSTNDTLYKDYFSALNYTLMTEWKNEHTLNRFQIEFSKKKTIGKAQMYPVFEGAEDCVIDFYLSAQFAKLGFGILITLALLL